MSDKMHLLPLPVNTRFIVGCRFISLDCCPHRAHPIAMENNFIEWVSVQYLRPGDIVLVANEVFAVEAWLIETVEAGPKDTTILNGGVYQNVKLVPSLYGGTRTVGNQFQVWRGIK